MTIYGMAWASMLVFYLLKNQIKGEFGWVQRQTIFAVIALFLIYQTEQVFLTWDSRGKPRVNAVCVVLELAYTFLPLIIDVLCVVNKSTKESDHEKNDLTVFRERQIAVRQNQSPHQNPRETTTQSHQNNY